MKQIAFTVFAAVLALAGCARESAERCDLSASREIVFSSDTAADVVTVRALGPACDKAIGVYAVEDTEGRPIWAWAAPLPRAFGDAFVDSEPETMQDFLDQWAQPELATTQAAPDWAALSPGQTTLDQLTYTDIRNRDLPMLCHYSGTGRQTCVFWEPAAGGAGHFIDREIEETAG